MTLDANIVAVESGVTYYRASSLGSCPRAFWFARHGFDPRDPPPAMQAVFDLGHEIEDRTVEILKAKGFDVSRRQEEVLFNVSDSLFIRGHIDGVMIPLDGTTYLVEIKGFGQDLLDQFERDGLASMPGYHLQVSAYCHALGIRDYIMVIYDKDASTPILDPSRIRVSFNPTPLLSRSQLSDVVAHLEFDSWDDVNRPPCTNVYPCPYYYLHDDERPVLTPGQELFAEGYFRLSEQIKQLEERRTSIRDRLLQQLDRTSVSDRFTVTVAANPERLDARKVRALLAEAGIPQSDFMTPSTGHHIRVTRKDLDAPSPLPGH